MARVPFFLQLVMLIVQYYAGMAPVKVPDRVIDLSEFIDISQYTIYHKAHVRLSSHYRINSDTSVNVVDNPGTRGAIYLSWHHAVSPANIFVQDGNASKHKYCRYIYILSTPTILNTLRVLSIFGAYNK